MYKFVQPVESKDFPGFYPIYGMDHHLISKEGEIVNAKTGKSLSVNINRNGYRFVTIRGEHIHGIRIHRSLALTFIPCPGDPDVMVVDHKDGHKLNNSLENLRWVTHKDNCEYAGKLGLTEKCTPIEIMDCITGEVTQYGSNAAAARDLHTDYYYVRTKISLGMNGARVWPRNSRWVLLRFGHTSPR